MADKENKKELAKEIKRLVTSNSKVIFNLREITGTSYDRLFSFTTVNLNEYSYEEAQDILNRLKTYLEDK